MKERYKVKAKEASNAGKDKERDGKGIEGRKY